MNSRRNLAHLLPVALCLLAAGIFHAPPAHAATYSGGTGTELAPYLISIPQDLQDLSNPANSADWDKHFLMTQDIDMAGVTGFAPIGNNSVRFTGVFDGNGNAIQDLNVDLPTEGMVGLFGRISGAGEVRNLGLQGGSMSGVDYVGGLVGFCQSGTMTACYATGIVTGSRCSGGLVGFLEGGTATACYATGVVTGSEDVGGLIGWNRNSTVAACYATGVVTGGGCEVGGLVGINEGGTVISCYATGNVTGGGCEHGGLVGTSEGGTATASFWDTETSGQLLSGGGKGLSTAEMHTVTDFQNAGWEAYDWVTNGGEYPRLAWEGTGAPAIPSPAPVPLVGSGTEGDPYRVGTTAEFALLNSHVGLLSAHILLTADLDWAGEALHPIRDLGPFTGVFDGDDHVIGNGTIAQPNSHYVGLFGVLSPAGEIRNLGVEGVAVIGDDYVGGLLGSNDHGTVTGCYATGAVTGQNAVGGLVGHNDAGTVMGCYATGTVQGGSQAGGLVGHNDIDGVVTSCFATGGVSGGGYVGGLVGRGGQITGGCAVTGCYATGTVQGTGDFVAGLIGKCFDQTLITSCYTTSIIYCPGSEVGGALGNSESEVRVTSTFWDVDLSGQFGSAGGKGISNSQMQRVRTFQNAGWGAYGWAMTEGDYPRLSWEGTGAPAIPAPEAIPLSGSGTEGDPYLVTTAQEFTSLSWHIGFLDAHSLLTTDVDCAGLAVHPIGDLGVFSGVFRGGQHIAKNVTIENLGNWFVGVFSRIGASAEISEFAVEDASVTGRNYVGILVGCSDGGTIAYCHSSGAVSGSVYVGGLVGYKEGSLTNCYAASSVTGTWTHSRTGGLVGGDMGSIADCFATGQVNGNNATGGLVGSKTGGSVARSYATGSVSGGYATGGLIGFNYSGCTVMRCYATGVVTGGSHSGGIVGHNDTCTIRVSYATGAVSGTENVGGAVGRLESGSLEESYATGSVFGNTNFGGLVGAATGTTADSFWDTTVGGPNNHIGIGLPIEQMIKRGTFESAGWDFTAGDGDDPDWFLYEDNSYPKLFAMPVPIKTIADLQLLNIASGGEFFLTGDIDASETAAWGSKSTQPGFSPIGSAASPFNGILHGNDHWIRDLHISRPTTDNVGLFGYIGATGVVDDLGLEQVTITGRDQVGGLAGVNLGTVERCYVRGEVTGVNAVGGLIGDNQGTVSNSYAAAALSGNTVGGLIGTDSSKSGKALPQSSAFGGPDSGAQAANIEED